jgi:tripartite-type tricarboxylate transporter receptor subunit TctC
MGLNFPVAAFLRIAALTIAVIASCGIVAAQDYPNRPVRLIVAFAPGGATDFTARIIADRVQSILGQPIAVENKPGANGAIGAEYVAKSDPDGYTLFFTTVGAVAINPALRSDLPYDPLKDFAAIGKAAVNSTILVVNADMKINSARELAELARRKPGSITIGITGRGAISDLGRPASSCRKCRIAARRRRSPTCWPATSTACSATCRRSWGRCRPAS